MKLTTELNLQTFEFWSGAKDHSFTHGELKELEFHLEDIFHDGATETQINDLFWFEEELLCQWLGIDFEDDYLNRD